MSEQKKVTRIFRQGNMCKPFSKEKYVRGDKVELSQANAEIFKACFEPQQSTADAVEEAAEAEAKKAKGK